MLEARFTSNTVEIIVHVHELEMYSAINFKAEALKHLEEKPQTVALNLAEVEFLDSSAIGAIFALRKFVLNYGGELILCHLTSQVKAIFQATKAAEFFRIFATTAEALGIATKPIVDSRDNGMI